LDGLGPDTNFSYPIKELRNLIIDREIRELLVVFLTDGDNKDKEETEIASERL
jgi:hypothetical protein